MGGQDIRNDLLLCLSDELRLEGDILESITEEDLMETIKRMAVLLSNLMVQRNQMRDHKKEENEKIRGFVARVREAAIDCKFEVQCNEDSCGKMVSYKE